MPRYVFGGIHKRGKRVVVDIPMLAVNVPTKAEVEKEAIADQATRLIKRMMGMAQGTGRFNGLAGAVYNDVAVHDASADLLDSREQAVSRMNKWCRLAVLNMKLLQQTCDRIVARAFNGR